MNNRRDYGSDDQQFGASSSPRRESGRQAQGFRQAPRAGEQYGQYSGQSPGGQQGGHSYDPGRFDQQRRTFRSEDEEEFGSSDAEGRVGGFEANPDPRMRTWAGTGPGYVEDWRTVTGEGDWRTPDFRRQQGTHESRRYSYGGAGDYDYAGSNYNRGRVDYNRGGWGNRWRDPGFDAGNYHPDRGGYSWEQDSSSERSRPTLRERIFGRGPKNYTRSDERVREEIHERLHAHPYVDSREVTIEVKDGTVVLAGTVTSRQDKHDIENIVDGVFGVKDIQNNVRVARST